MTISYGIVMFSVKDNGETNQQIEDSLRFLHKLGPEWDFKIERNSSSSIILVSLFQRGDVTLVKNPGESIV